MKQVKSTKKLTANITFARDLSQRDRDVFFVRKGNETINKAVMRAMKEQNVFSGDEEFIQARCYDGRGKEIVRLPEYHVRLDGIFIAEVKVSEAL